MDSYETKIYIAILIGAAILGIILAYFVITIIRHQRRAVQFHEEKIRAEISTLEKDRSRIVADLHDELGPLLSTVRMELNSLETPLEQDHKLIDKASNHLDNVLERIREISRDLMPQALTRKGLATALEEFVNELNAGNGPKINLTIKKSLVLVKEFEIHIYRILQEIINNALKHSEATEIVIKICQSATLTQLSVTDNGCGFIPHAINPESMGLGLKNIMSRVDIMKGDLYLDSSPGEGTRYTIEIPLAT
ncbi:MAG: sensor histidine kinase [Chitinophagaceae bacterium]|nr:sensor histidine kinase [Chitinophagaceae bacterium]